ncbi:MAG: tetratricopeptide repeat protein [Deltaproteobacteria bacterium]|nr:tetratricopeptide repeat protein [Deltaproteobacteria bacterium]
MKQRKKKEGKDMVMKETLLLAVFISLVVGFVGGVVFSAYQFDSGREKPLKGPAKGQEHSEAAEILAQKIAALEEAASREPGNPHAWALLGNAYFDANRVKKAIIAYEKSLDLDSGNPNVWTDLGVMYRRNKQPEKAVEAFGRANAIDPGHEASLFNQGIVLFHDLNDREGAIKAWEELITKHPMARGPSGKLVAEFLGELKKAAKQSEVPPAGAK